MKAYDTIIAIALLIFTVMSLMAAWSTSALFGSVVTVLLVMLSAVIIIDYIDHKHYDD